jgi:hypothetical protein
MTRAAPGSGGPAADAGSVAVDIASLEDFRRTLDTRLSQANALLGRIDQVVDRRPAVGTLPTGLELMTDFAAQSAAYRDRIVRLRESLVVARDNTDTIIENYRTAEERNAANAHDIARQLSGVDTALAVPRPAEGY